MQRYLLFAAIEQAEFHANIVERFTQSLKVSGHYNSNRDNYHLHDPDWRILGGGHWEYQAATDVLTLFGRSLAYGPVQLDWVSQKLTDCHAFNHARISVRE